MADLLNTLNEQKKAKTTVTSETTDQSVGKATDNLAAGTDLLKTAARTEQEKTEQKEEVSEAKTDDTNSTVQEPGTWTKETALLEVKKLREENKLRRLREKEIETEYDKKFETFKVQMQEQMETALAAKKELETLKSKEEDKKRSIEEKLAHRESVISETQARMQALENDFQRQLEEKENALKELQAAQEVHLGVYRSRIDEELQHIPESKRKFANLIVKGYKDGSQDPREAWTALAEAKAEGLFSEKEVIVSHASPSTSAARMTQERIEEVAKAKRDSMSSADLIRSGLKTSSNRRGKIL